MTKYVRCPETGSAIPIPERKIKWEMYCDESYFYMWAVRPKGDKDFNSPRLFHLDNKYEAKRLMDFLNSLRLSNE